MPISYAVFLDIRLSLPINTLTLSAIEAAWERTQITNSTGAVSGLDWDPDCWLVDAWLACPRRRRLASTGQGRNGRNRMTKASNVILVHGAWADGSSWSKVIPLLLARGLRVTAVQLPL